MGERRLEYLPIDELAPAAKNPKKHAIGLLADSLDQHGYTEPLLVDERTGRLVAGHGRLEALQAAQAAGGEPPDGVTVADGRWLVPVVRGWASTDDYAASRYLVASNALVERGGWDDRALADLLAELGGNDPGLVGTGYGPDDLDGLLARLAAAEPPALPVALTDPDEVPEPPAVPVTKRGDLWLLGEHRLLCGDATDQTEMAHLLDGATPLLLLTDPPYCSGGFQESGRASGSVGTDAPHKQIINDTLSTRGYIALMKTALTVAPCRFAYVFTDWRMWVNLFDVVESSGYGVRSMVVWDKGSPGMGRGWRSQHELVMWAAKETAPFDKFMSGFGNVIQSQRTGNPLHTTQKPVDLLETLLKVTEFAPTVLDPFAGSGSTLIAAHQQGRQAFVSELDLSYCDVICRRFQALTGTKPVLESTGEAHDFTA